MIEPCNCEDALYEHVHTPAGIMRYRAVYKDEYRPGPRKMPLNYRGKLPRLGARRSKGGDRT